jgi:hypothetical protein
MEVRRYNQPVTTGAREFGERRIFAFVTDYN